MKPQGHLITSVIATGATYAVTGSSELAIGVFCGAFWIDLDHYLDYVVFERQFSLNPFRFIRYYLDNQARRLVLVLHSYELMFCLGLLAMMIRSLPLIGYLIGATMHLILDIRYNDTLRNPFRFYSFSYRQRRGFKTIRGINKRCGNR
ncbi:MAG: hypothetical protein C4293_21750, partial [Nitrospiraceae bacterium]